MQEKSTKPAKLATMLCPDRAQALIGEILYKWEREKEMSYEKLNEKILEMKDEMFDTIRENVAICSVKGEPEEDAPFCWGKDGIQDRKCGQPRRLDRVWRRRRDGWSARTRRCSSSWGRMEL